MQIKAGPAAGSKAKNRRRNATNRFNKTSHPSTSGMEPTHEEPLPANEDANNVQFQGEETVVEATQSVSQVAKTEVSMLEQANLAGQTPGIQEPSIQPHEELDNEDQEPPAASQGAETKKEATPIFPQTAEINLKKKASAPNDALPELEVGEKIIARVYGLLGHTRHTEIAFDQDALKPETIFAHENRRYKIVSILNLDNNQLAVNAISIEYAP